MLNDSNIISSITTALTSFSGSYSKYKVSVPAPPLYLNSNDDELLTACKTGTTFVDEKYGLDYIRYVEVTKPYFNTKNVGEDDYYSIYYCCEDGNYSMEINETTRFNNNNAKVK